MQEGYKEKVINHSNSFVSIKIEDLLIKNRRICKRNCKNQVKGKTSLYRQFTRDKRWKNGFLGEYAVEKFMEKNLSISL